MDGSGLEGEALLSSCLTGDGRRSTRARDASAFSLSSWPFRPVKAQVPCLCSLSRPLDDLAPILTTHLCST